jgi:hypothetical protein
VAVVRFRSKAELAATVEALDDACNSHRDAQGRLDVPHTLMMTALITAYRRRTPDSGVTIELDDAHVELAHETLGDSPRRAVFER